MTQSITITLDPEPFRIALENTAGYLCAMRPEVAEAVLKEFACGFLFALPIVPTGEPGCYVLRAENLPWEFGRKVADATSYCADELYGCRCSPEHALDSLPATGGVSAAGAQVAAG